MQIKRQWHEISVPSLPSLLPPHNLGRGRVCTRKLQLQKTHIHSTKIRSNYRENLSWIESLLICCFLAKFYLVGLVLFTYSGLRLFLIRHFFKKIICVSFIPSVFEMKCNFCTFYNLYTMFLVIVLRNTFYFPALDIAKNIFQNALFENQ